MNSRNNFEEYRNELEEYIRNHKNTKESQLFIDYMDEYRRKKNNNELIRPIDTIIFKVYIRSYIAELFTKNNMIQKFMTNILSKI